MPENAVLLFFLMKNNNEAILSNKMYDSEPYYDTPSIAHVSLIISHLVLGAPVVANTVKERKKQLMIYRGHSFCLSMYWKIAENYIDCSHVIENI